MTGNVKRLQANGLSFAVFDQGDAGATAVVLLHGFPNNKNMWGKQVGLYAGMPYSLISITGVPEC